VAAVRAIDTKTGEKGGYSAYLAITRRGLRRWYVSSTERRGQWFRALGDPATLSVFEEWVEPVIARYLADFDTFNEAGLVALGFPSSIVPVRPDHSKAPIPADIMPVVRSVDGNAWVLVQEPVLLSSDDMPLDDGLIASIRDDIIMGKIVRAETSTNDLERLLSALPADS
jgi:hypothetical protein